MNDRESIGRALAAGMKYEQQNKEISETLIDNIVNNFNLLTNMDPSLAIGVLESLNEQITEEEVKKLIKSRNDVISKMGDQIGSELLLED